MAVTNPPAKRTTVFKELLYMLDPTYPRPLPKSGKKKAGRHRQLSVRQLRDGSIYIYSNDELLASFAYGGGTDIRRVKINTKSYINRDVSKSSFYMHDRTGEGGSRLKEVLDELFPDTIKECLPSMRYAYEFSIIESALRDPTTQIEVSNIHETWFDVALVNVEGFVSCSFRFRSREVALENVYLKYSPKKKIFRAGSMRFPEDCLDLFWGLLERDLIPIS